MLGSEIDVPKRFNGESSASAVWTLSKLRRWNERGDSFVLLGTAKEPTVPIPTEVAESHMLGVT